MEPVAFSFSALTAERTGYIPPPRWWPEPSPAVCRNYQVRMKRLPRLKKSAIPLSSLLSSLEHDWEKFPMLLQRPPRRWLLHARMLVHTGC